MKDFAKFIVAGAILSCVIAYGFFDAGSNANEARHAPVAKAERVEAGGGPAAPSVGRAGAVESMPAAPKAAAEAGQAKQPAAAVKTKSTRRFVVYFDFDSAGVTSRAQETIGEAMAFARSVGAERIELAGFADRAGSTAYNVRLSERRAGVVAAALGGLGVGSQQIRLTAFGEAQPAVDTPDGQAEPRNRRVEIIVTA